MNLTFAQAKPTDLDALYDLNKSLILQYEDLSTIDQEAVLSWVRRKLEKKLTEYQTVLLDGKKGGYFRLCDGEDGALELDDLYVLSPFRGQGIGTEIIRHCIAESKRQNKPLMLYVFTRNAGAVRLYERLGFHLKETVSPTRMIMIR